MSVVSVTDARNHSSGVIARAQNEAVFIERRGHLAAVVLSPELHARMLEALEDAEDQDAFDKSMAEPGLNVSIAEASVAL